MKFDGINSFEIEYQETKTIEHHHWIHEEKSLQVEVGFTYIEVQRPTLKWQTFQWPHLMATSISSAGSCAR